MELFGDQEALWQSCQSPQIFLRKKSSIFCQTAGHKLLQQIWYATCLFWLSSIFSYLSAMAAVRRWTPWLKPWQEKDSCWAASPVRRERRCPPEPRWTGTSNRFNETGTFRCTIHRTLFLRQYNENVTVEKEVELTVVAVANRELTSVIAEIMMYVLIVVLQLWLIGVLIYCYKKISEEYEARESHKALKAQAVLAKDNCDGVQLEWHYQ